jgi:hypothetical protein
VLPVAKKYAFKTVYLSTRRTSICLQWPFPMESESSVFDGKDDVYFEASEAFRNGPTKDGCGLHS